MATPSIHIEQASGADASVVASVLQEAAQWLADDGRPLWAPSSISFERVSQDIEKMVFFVARNGDAVAGVMKFELEDAFFWPEIASGTSAFVHKLAVRRAWAKQGISNQLLAFARTRAKNLGLQHLRLDCMADRAGLRQLYEGFGFTLHSYTDKGGASFARYALSASVILQPVAASNDLEPNFDVAARRV